MWVRPFAPPPLNTRPTFCACIWNVRTKSRKNIYNAFFINRIIFDIKPKIEKNSLSIQEKGKNCVLLRKIWLQIILMNQNIAGKEPDVF
jgi:hypothetical protein